VPGDLVAAHVVASPLYRSHSLRAQ
jgi:hypothetical protein